MDDTINGAPGVTTEDLEKSLEQLEEMATQNDTPSRKEALLAKASAGELEKSERDELFEILGGSSVEPETETATDLVKGLETNEPLQKALDVSDFLKEQHDELVKSLRAVGDTIEASDNRRHEFNLVMAKAIHDIGYLVKSMAEGFEDMMSQPARGPKSRGTPRVLAKSFGGQTPPGGQPNNDAPGGGGEYLSKGEILAALQGMSHESMSKGMGGRAGCGEDLMMSVAKYEQTNRISPQLYKEVAQFVQEKRGAAH